MVLRAVKNSNVKGYFKLLFDTGTREVWLLVSDAQYKSAGSPAPCDEVSNEDFLFLKSSDEYNRAKKKALNILAFGDNSKRELTLKLSRAKFSFVTVEKITEEMLGLGYINEERQLLRLVENEANLKMRGPKKIISHLLQKGYAPEKIKSAIATLLADGKIDFDETKKKLLSGAKDDEDKRKILYKNGF